METITRAYFHGLVPQWRYSLILHVYGITCVLVEFQGARGVVMLLKIGRHLLVYELAGRHPPVVLGKADGSVYTQGINIVGNVFRIP